MLKSVGTLAMCSGHLRYLHVRSGFALLLSTMVNDARSSHQPAEHNSTLHSSAADNFADLEFYTPLDVELEPAGSLGFHKSRQVCLDLEDLDGFTVLTDQFAESGVLFENAIAITPSNPAFPVRSGKRVLIGAPSAGWLSATFNQPVAWVGAYITGSKSVLISAFDATDRLLAQAELPSANMANGRNNLPPNHPMLLQADGIASVRVDCAGGQFTLDDFSYSY